MIIKNKTKDYFVQLNADETGVFITVDENYNLEIRDIFIGAFGIAKIFFVLNNKTSYISATCDGWDYINITEVE